MKPRGSEAFATELDRHNCTVKVEWDSLALLPT
jgi:hypothetical protein